MTAYLVIDGQGVTHTVEAARLEADDDAARVSFYDADDQLVARFVGAGTVAPAPAD